ncbi:MAG: xanthine phosphoribosyltransferase [Bacillota bacterium]
MELLKERIREEGKVKAGDILKVDSFLNHQIDPELMNEMGKEFVNRFGEDGITKILTIEASGIAVATMVGLELEVPVLFARKDKPSNMDDNSYSAEVKSYTKNKVYNINVAKEYLEADDKVLIIDDFLAMGQAASGLIEVVEQAGAEVVGVGTVIEKGFQPGGDNLRQSGVKVESLAIVDELTENEVIFAENNE